MENGNQVITAHIWCTNIPVRFGGEVFTTPLHFLTRVSYTVAFTDPSPRADILMVEMVIQVEVQGFPPTALVLSHVNEWVRVLGCWAELSPGAAQTPASGHRGDSSIPAFTHKVKEWQKAENGHGWGKKTPSAAPPAATTTFSLSVTVCVPCKYVGVCVCASPLCLLHGCCAPICMCVEERGRAGAQRCVKAV